MGLEQILRLVAPDDRKAVRFNGQSAEDDIDMALERMGLILRRSAAGKGRRPYDRLKVYALTIHKVSDTPGLEMVRTVAHAMSEYVEQLRKIKSWDLQGLTLYRDTMRCLRRPLSENEGEEVLRGLQKVAEIHLRASPTGA